MGLDISEEGLKKSYKGSFTALIEATNRLDNYYTAVANGRPNASDGLLIEVNAIKKAIDDSRNASANYVSYLEEQVRTYRDRISKGG